MSSNRDSLPHEKSEQRLMILKHKTCTSCYELLRALRHEVLPERTNGKRSHDLQEGRSITKQHSVWRDISQACTTRFYKQRTAVRYTSRNASLHRDYSAVHMFFIEHQECVVLRLQPDVIPDYYTYCLARHAGGRSGVAYRLHYITYLLTYSEKLASIKHLSPEKALTLEGPCRIQFLGTIPLCTRNCSATIERPGGKHV